MTDTNETRRIVEEIYRAAAAGDLDTLRDCLADEIVIHEPPALPYGGVYTGFDAFAGCFGTAIATINLPHLILESLTVEGADAFGVVTVPLTAGEGTARIIEHWTVSDGKVTEGWVYWFDTTIVPQSPAGAGTA